LRTTQQPVGVNKNMNDHDDDYIIVKKNTLKNIQQNAIRIKDQVIQERKNTIPLLNGWQFLQLFTSYFCLLIPPLGWSGTHHYLDGDYSLTIIYSATFGICGLGYLCDFFFIYFSRNGYIWYFIRNFLYPFLLGCLIILTYGKFNIQSPPLIECILLGMFFMNQITWLTTPLLMAFLWVFPQFLTAYSPPINIVLCLLFNWRVSSLLGSTFPLKYLNDFKIKYVALCAIPLSIGFYGVLMLNGDGETINVMLKKYITHIGSVVPQR